MKLRELLPILSCAVELRIKLEGGDVLIPDRARQREYVGRDVLKLDQDGKIFIAWLSRF